MKTLPIFYFRPTVIYIDDDIAMTHSVEKLVNSIYSTRTFNNTTSLLNYLDKYQSILEQKPILRNFNESEYSDSPDTSLVEFKFNSLSNLFNEYPIENEIGVMIIDYLMPDMDGISLCKKIRDYPFKKLLLTGSDNLKAGIDAWNLGLIDGFIKKTASSEEILYKIQELSFKYFIERTISLNQHLESNHLLPLSDKLFVNYFLKIFEENNIKEYYLIDKNGSLLMKDKNNRKSVLIVHTEESLAQFLKLIPEEIKHNDLGNLIKTKEKIPYINPDNVSDLNLLKNSLYTPELLMGREAYYIHHLILF